MTELITGWKITIGDQTYPVRVHIKRQAFYGLTGEAMAVIESAVPPDLLKNQLSGPFVLYAETDAGDVRVASGWVAKADVYPISPDKRAARLYLAGYQRLLKDITLTLKPYASTPTEREIASKMGTVYSVENCESRCSDPLISSLAADVTALFGDYATWELVWDPPSEDPVKVTDFTATLSDGTTVTVPLTREAVVKRAGCVPTGGCPASGPCGADLDPTVGARYCCWVKWNSMPAEEFFAENISEGQETVVLGSASGTPIDQCSPVSGGLAVSVSNRLFCSSSGCFPSPQGGAEVPCDIPDIQLLDSTAIRVPVFVTPMAGAKTDEINLLADLLKINLYSNMLTVTYDNGTTCTKTVPGTWIEIESSIGKTPKFPDPIAVAWAAFELARQFAAALGAWFVKHIVKPVFDFVTWGADIAMRFMSSASAMASLLSEINNCMAKRARACREAFCERWANLVEYDMAKVAETLGITLPQVSTFFIAVSREYVKLSAFDLMNILAFLSGKVADYGDGAALVDLGANATTLDGCNAGAQLAKAEFSADMFTLISPVLPRSLVESWLAEQIEAGAELSCLPYKLADFLEAPLIIKATGGATKEVTADLAEHPELVRAFLTHKNAGLIKISLDLNEFPQLLTAKPGDALVIGDISLYLVDIEIRDNHAELLTVRPDTVAKVELLTPS